VTSLLSMRKWLKLVRELSGKNWLDLVYAKVLYFLFSGFREVFKARAKNDNKFVAMKRVLMENEKEGVRLRKIIENFPF